MARRKSTPAQKPEPPEPWRFETETYVRPYERYDTPIFQHPAEINGRVQVRRYRVVYELIDEPLEVIHERLIALWLSESGRALDAIEREALRYGLDVRAVAEKRRRAT